MSKHKPSQEGEGRSKPGKTTTKVATDLLKKAKMVAAYRDVDLFDYLDAALRPTVERDYSKMIQDEAEA